VGWGAGVPTDRSSSVGWGAGRFWAWRSATKAATMRG
jgi:hypothetical protein